MRTRNLLTIGLLLISTPAAAGENVWTSNGPYGGPGARVVVSPASVSRLYAVSNGLYRSDDGGTTWTPLIGAPSTYIAPDATDPDVVYAPGFISTDAGRTWSGSHVYEGFEDFAVDPRHPTTQYAARVECFHLTCSGGVLRSTDGGRIWTPLLVGYTTAVRLHPTDSNTLFALTEVISRDALRISRTTDGGSTWRTVLERQGWHSHELVFDPRDPAVIYVAAYSEPGGLLRSPDGGDSWRVVSDTPARSLVVDPATSTVFVSTVNGLLKGPDFTATGLGVDFLRAGRIEALALAPTRPATLYAGVFPYGVLRSTDAGTSFAPANRGLDNLATIAVVRSSSGRLYASGGLVQRSDDSGASWQPLTAGPASLDLPSLALDPSSPDKLFVSSYPYGSQCYSCPGQLFETMDGGTSWLDSSIQFTKRPADLLVDPHTPSTVYVAAGDVFKSVNGGVSWRSAGLVPGDAPDRPSAACLALDPTGTTLYAGAAMYRDVFKSTDAGDTWVPARNGLPGLGVSAILVDTASPATLFAATGGGVFKSTDAGSHWSASSVGLPEYPQATLDLLQDPARPATLYAATRSGVFKSGDAGGHWRALSEGLERAEAAYALAYDPSTFTLHAATARGVFARTILNPPPVLSSLRPSADGKLNGGLPLTITGSSFVEESVVLWNGAPRDTTYVSATELLAQVLSSDTMAAGTAAVSVRSPAPGGGTSNTLTFTILDALPPPSISSLSPASLPAGSPAFELDVYGSDLTFRSEVLWNGEPRPTRILSSAHLVATMSAQDVAVPGAAAVAVRTPGAGTSASLPFAVDNYVSVRFLPVVLDAVGRNGSWFTTELTLVNRGSTEALLQVTYVPASSLGASGGGTYTEALAAHQQSLIPDALEHLRAKGLPIPREGPQGGSLRIAFRNLSSPRAGYAAARITTPSGSGRAGVAMVGLAPEELFTGGAYVFGLRENVKDRSNLAIVNAGDAGPITLRVGLFSGKPLPNVTLAAGQWAQLGSELGREGYESGWAKVDRVSGTAPFYAYGVVNDNRTNDGSIVPGVAAVPVSSTVPVVVKTSRYESELVLANPHEQATTAFLTATLPEGGSTFASVELGGFEQKILPRIVDVLLDSTPGPHPVTYAGSVTVAGSGPLYAASRTETVGPGGAYGVFTPAVDRQATREGWVFGLRNDAEARSNLAIASASSLQVAVELYSGETGEKLAALGPFTIDPHGSGTSTWLQLNSPLAPFSVTHGWAHIVNLSPSGEFLAYGVVNDRGTDDGSYLPMDVER